MLYPGYWEDWHVYKQYQFNGYKYCKDEAFYFVPQKDT